MSDEINRKIFEYMHPNKCWHELAPDRWVWRPGKYWFSKAIHNPDCNKCIHCGRQVMPYHSSGPGYEESGISENRHGYQWDLNKIRKVELKVISEFGPTTYGAAIASQLREGFQLHPKDNFEMIVVIAATADAPTRARAVYELIQEK